MLGHLQRTRSWQRNQRTHRNFTGWKYSPEPLERRDLLTLTLDWVPLNATTRGANPSHFLAVGDEVYFSAVAPDIPRSLWRSDGTFDGTTRVFDRNLWSNDEWQPPVDVNGTLFFAARDAIHGMELWRSDDTMEKDLFFGV